MAAIGALRYDDDYADTVALADGDERVGRPAREDWADLLVSAEWAERFAGRVVEFHPRAHDTVALLRLRDRRLRVPLVVSVEETGDGIVISQDDLNIWGSGENRYAAVEDFSQTFIDVFESYRDTPAEQLSPDAAQYLEELRRYIA